MAAGACRGCGMLSALGGVAARRWRAGLLWKRVEQFEAVRAALREMYRLPDGAPAELGAKMPARGSDASG